MSASSSPPAAANTPRNAAINQASIGSIQSSTLQGPSQGASPANFAFLPTLSGNLGIEAALSTPLPHSQSLQNLFGHNGARGPDLPALGHLSPQDAFRLALDTFTGEILPYLEEAGDRVFDGIDNALQPGTDVRQVEADLQLLLATLDAAMTYAQQTGIAAIPMQAPGSTAEAGGGRTLAEQTAEMSVAAREMFDRRARLREGSAIVGGILNAPLVPGR